MTNKFAITDTFLNAAAPLTPRNAVAAIILDDQDRVLLQLRDDKERVFFPNHWGCFGGAMEPGETPLDAALRELHEELGITFDAAHAGNFINIAFTTKASSKTPVDRHYFIFKIQPEDAARIQLGEGRAFEFFTCKELMGFVNVVPYDRFALWLYFNQNRLPD